MPGKVFISYSHKDERAKTELHTHFNVGVMAGKLEVWEDRQIGVGDGWEAAIEAALNDCSVAVLLISANFLSSGFINGVEVPKLLQRRQDEGLKVFPVMWSGCDWKAVEWLPAMNIFPRDARPMKGMTVARRDEQFATFAEMVRRHIEIIDSQPSQHKEIKEAREAVQAAARRLFANVGENRRPILRAQLEAGLLALTSGDDASKTDIADLVDLQLAMDGEAHAGNGPTFSIKGLSKLMAAVNDLKGRSGECVDLDDDLKLLVETALEDVRSTLLSNKFPACTRQLEGFRNVLADALCLGVIRLGQASWRADLVAETDRDCVEAGRTAIQICVGLNLDRAPQLSAFRERLSKGGTAPLMVIIPTGQFLMGAPDSDNLGDDRARPQHQVIISERFAIGRYPVSFDEHDRACKETEAGMLGDEGWGRRSRPMINCSWNDTLQYLGWLNVQVGHTEDRPYRLPSEAEWEYACRAGTTTRYPWGDDFDKSKLNSLESRFGKTTKTGSYPPNGWGLFDMMGNVLEWCADSYMEDYSTPREQAPHQSGERLRVVRGGGSWFNDARYCRAAYRGRVGPVNRFFNLGFRPARNLS